MVTYYLWVSFKFNFRLLLYLHIICNLETCKFLFPFHSFLKRVSQNCMICGLSFMCLSTLDICDASCLFLCMRVYPSIWFELPIGKCANRLLGSSGLPLIAGQMKVYLKFMRSVHLAPQSLLQLPFWHQDWIVLNYVLLMPFCLMPVETGIEFYMGPPRSIWGSTSNSWWRSISFWRSFCKRGWFHLMDGK